jgi:hypothetical protein
VVLTFEGTRRVPAGGGTVFLLEFGVELGPTVVAFTVGEEFVVSVTVVNAETAP